MNNNCHFITGIIALTHLAIWSCFVTSHPRDHKMIRKEELSILDYTSTKSNSSSDVAVKDMEGNSSSSTISSDVKLRVPWMALFTSPPVLALLFFRFSFFWTFLMIMNKLPTYMNDILHVSPTEVHLQLESPKFMCHKRVMRFSFHSMSSFCFIIINRQFFFSFFSTLEWTIECALICCQQCESGDGRIHFRESD